MVRSVSNEIDDKRNNQCYYDRNSSAQRLLLTKQNTGNNKASRKWIPILTLAPTYSLTHKSPSCDQHNEWCDELSHGGGSFLPMQPTGHVGFYAAGGLHPVPRTQAYVGRTPRSSLTVALQRSPGFSNRTATLTLVEPR